MSKNGGRFVPKHGMRQLWQKEPVDVWDLLTDDEKAVAKTLFDRQSVRDLIKRAGNFAREAAAEMERLSVEPVLVSRTANVATLAEQAELKISRTKPKYLDWVNDPEFKDLVRRSAITCAVHLATTARVIKYIQAGKLQEEDGKTKFSAVFSNTVRALAWHADFVDEPPPPPAPDPLEAEVQQLLEDLGIDPETD